MAELAVGMRQVIEALDARTEPPRWSPPSGEQVKALRERLKLTQSEFADRFKIDLASLRNWEQGRNTPEPAARQLLWMIDADPNAALCLIRKAAETKRS